jgi:hypothetical protein
MVRHVGVSTAVLHRTKEALNCLRGVVHSGWRKEWVKNDPDLISLRDNPEFQRLLDDCEQAWPLDVPGPRQFGSISPSCWRITGNSELTLFGGHASGKPAARSRNVPVYGVTPVIQAVQRNQRHIFPLPRRPECQRLVSRLDPRTRIGP